MNSRLNLRVHRENSKGTLSFEKTGSKIVEIKAKYFNNIVSKCDCLVLFRGFYNL